MVPQKPEDWPQVFEQHLWATPTGASARGCASRERFTKTDESYRSTAMAAAWVVGGR
jgi:hypothetical protein